MYIKIDDKFDDGDMQLLAIHVAILDSTLTELHERIFQSIDPDADGLLDKAEYFIGSGFAVIQQYMSTTYPYIDVDKAMALSTPPYALGEITVAQAINAGANYWKHLDEWGLRNIVDRDMASLTGHAKNTIETIQRLTPWTDYTCSNLLAVLNSTSHMALSPLIPIIEQWRNNLDDHTRRKRKA